MFMITSLVAFIMTISWDVSLTYFTINFILMVSYLNGNQFLIFDKNMISSMMILLTILIIILMIQASSLFYSSNKNFMKLYCINIFIMTIILMMCFYSMNFFKFYFLFELVVIPTFFIIMGWGYSSERIQAGIYLFIYTLLASLPFLIFLIFFYTNNNTLLFDNSFFCNNFIKNSKLWWIVISGVFMVKMPVFLVHIWLPKAHVEAPVSGSMILAGILLKLGSYGFLKSFSVSLIYFYTNTILYSISMIGTLIISLNCLRQKDLKCLVAYSSVAHMNMMMMAMLSFSWISMKSSIMMMIAHGLSSSAMFFILNIFYLVNKSRSIMIMKSLMMSSAIISFWWFLLCCLNMACPPSINFISEIFILISIMSFDYFCMSFLFLILIISGIYSIMLFNSSNHGNKSMKYNFNLNSCNDLMILSSHAFLSFFFVLLIFMI